MCNLFAIFVNGNSRLELHSSACPLTTKKAPGAWPRAEEDVPRGDRVERMAYPNLPAVEAIRKAA